MSEWIDLELYGTYLLDFLPLAVQLWNTYWLLVYPKALVFLFMIIHSDDVRALHYPGLAPGHRLRSPRPSQLRPEDPRAGAADTESPRVCMIKHEICFSIVGFMRSFSASLQQYWMKNIIDNPSLMNKKYFGVQERLLLILFFLYIKVNHTQQPKSWKILSVITLTGKVAECWCW